MSSPSTHSHKNRGMVDYIIYLLLLTICKDAKIAKVIPSRSLTMVTVGEQPKQTVTAARLFNGCRRCSFTGSTGALLLLLQTRRNWAEELLPRLLSRPGSRQERPFCNCSPPFLLIFIVHFLAKGAPDDPESFLWHSTGMLIQWN